MVVVGAEVVDVEAGNVVNDGVSVVVVGGAAVEPGTESVGVDAASGSPHAATNSPSVSTPADTRMHDMARP